MTGRFHYFRGKHIVQEENASDYALMERMLEQLHMDWEDLLQSSNAREYAMGVLTIQDGEAKVAWHNSAESSLQAEITMKQFSQSEPEFNLSPDARADADRAFRQWATEQGYEPVISPLWARPPGP